MEFRLHLLIQYQLINEPCQLITGQCRIQCRGTCSVVELLRHGSDCLLYETSSRMYGLSVRLFTAGLQRTDDILQQGDGVSGPLRQGPLNVLGYYLCDQMPLGSTI